MLLTELKLYPIYIFFKSNLQLITILLIIIIKLNKIITPMRHHKKDSKHHSGDLQIQNLDLIEGQVEKRLVNPQETSYCNCSLCLVNYQLKERGKTFLRQTSSNMKIQSNKIQQFLHLISAINSKMYMRLDIPQICFFYKGQARRLYKSNNSGVHQIELTPTVRKNLVNVFLENRRANLATNKTTESMDNFLASGDTHIKNFSSVIPSFKHGEKIDTKKPQTYIFHNDSKFTEDPNFNIARSQSQEICILKSRDKGLQLINQKQLRQTLKSLLYLQNVDFIQSYIKPNEREDQIFQGSYTIIKGPENQLMFNRSLTQVKIQINLVNKFSKDYISLQHLQSYQSLLKDIPQQYCLYQTYKMIHYMELTKDVKIESLTTLWLRNQAQDLCFFGLSEFEWVQNEKFSVDVGQIQQLKQIMNSELSDFEHELLRAWEHMKIRKLKPEQKVQIDAEKQLQYQRIRKQSNMRAMKQKQQQQLKKTRKKSVLERSITSSNH